jgi:hypothetical protein
MSSKPVKSTGGAGFAFETKVDAFFAAAMLAEGDAFQLGKIGRLEFQRRAKTGTSLSLGWRRRGTSRRRGDGYSRASPARPRSPPNMASPERTLLACFARFA